MRSETRGSRFEFQVEIDILPVTVTHLRFILIIFVFLPSGQTEERQLRACYHDLDHFMIIIIIIIIIINNNNIIIIIIIIINCNIIIIIIIII